jgi:hypothetical protein
MMMILELQLIEGIGIAAVGSPLASAGCAELKAIRTSAMFWMRHTCLLQAVLLKQLWKAW